MTPSVLILVKDASGIAQLGERLSHSGKIDIRANAPAAKELERVGVDCSIVEEREGLALLSNPTSRPKVLIANYEPPEVSAASTRSWKAAMESFDLPIVDAIKTAARSAETLIVGTPESYAWLAHAVDENGGIEKFDADIVRESAISAMRAVSAFDFAISLHLEINTADRPDVAALSGYPKALQINWHRSARFDQGLNPHQKSALYGTFSDHMDQLGGPNATYETIANISAAVFFIGEFEKSAIGIVQKGMLVDAAVADDPLAAWAKLIDAPLDPEAVIVTNASLSGECISVFLERNPATIVGPRFDEDARSLLAKSETCRWYTSKESLGYDALTEARSVLGGALLQDLDRSSVNPFEWKTFTAAQPLVDQWSDMLFAVKTVRHFRSSACIAVRNERIEAKAIAAASQSDAWTRLLSTNAALDNCVVAFEEPIRSIEILAQAKERGIRLILHPGHIDESQEQTLRENAASLGLALTQTGKSQIRF